MHNSLLTEKFWIPHEDCLLTHACSPHHLVPPLPPATIHTSDLTLAVDYVCIMCASIALYGNGIEWCPMSNYQIWLMSCLDIYGSSPFNLIQHTYRNSGPPMKTI